MTYSQFRNEQNSFLSTHGNLKYIDKGQGKVIVLLHGVPTSGWLYRKIIDTLTESYRVIVPDMLGFGSSDSPKGYEIYEPKEHALRLIALMDSLNIKEWTHVFHDAGGLWTWELLKKHKGLFKSGLLDADIMDKNAIEGYKKPMLEGKTKAMYQFFSNTCNDLPNYSNVIKNLNMPKLLIWGKHDEFLVLDKMKEQVASDLKMEQNNIHIIEAKHFIQEEKPKEISNLILSFLDK